jgi:hypothetical protein
VKRPNMRAVAEVLGMYPQRLSRLLGALDIRGAFYENCKAARRAEDDQRREELSE